MLADNLAKQEHTSSLDPITDPWSFRTSTFVILVLICCTALGNLTACWLKIENVAMIYLLGVVVVASRYGGKAGFATGLLSIPAFDLFITEPKFQLSALESQLPVTYMVMFIIAGFMNHLTGKIRRLLESLEKRVRLRTIELEQEVLRRREAESELKEVIRTLIRSNATLINFGRLASHDLQEPLRTIEGFGELLQKRYTNCLDEKGSRFLRIIVETARYAEKNVENLLHHARASAEEKEFARVDLNQVMGQVILSLSASISRSGCTIDKKRMPVVRGNESLLCQLFQNLIVNAINYSGDGPPAIVIDATTSSSYAQIEVRDRGIGFKASNDEIIFEPFVRLSGAGGEGSGLGLSICKTIAELHEGEISAHSKEGEGTTVIVRLPLYEEVGNQGEEDHEKTN
ncbi:MAG: DUF4118 domain-containing protein [Candidatus Melainabacteria bacterium]|nr:DUF4118 domain-containing protein [Candidatus Melainabacteria bacterium]